MTPGVKTTFLSNINPMALPENSYYAVIGDFIKGLADGKRQDDAMSSVEYAIKVVREVERGTTGKIWPGRIARIVRLLSWLLPQILIVSAELRSYGFCYMIF
jgi:1-acylglycerone phosphate reductase